MTEPPATPEFPAPPADARLVVSTAPPDVAHELARHLVEERLAACVNLVPGLRSVYRWQDAVCDDPETMLVVKTRASCLEALGRRLRDLHPYEVPEMVVVRPEAMSAAYRTWLEAQVDGPSAPPAPDAAHLK